MKGFEFLYYEKHVTWDKQNYTDQDITTGTNLKILCRTCLNMEALHGSKDLIYWDSVYLSICESISYCVDILAKCDIFILSE